MDEPDKLNTAPIPEAPASEPVLENQVGQPGTDATIPGGSTEAASSSWLNDESRDFYKSYGLSDDELSGFQSQAEADRLARILDRQYASLGEAARKATQPAPEKTEKAPESPAPAAAQSTFTRVDLAKLKAAGYEDEVISQFAVTNQAIDALERLEKERAAERNELSEVKKHFTSWQQYQQEQQQQQLIDAFHQAVDTLADDKLGKAFGEDGRAQQFTNEQLDRRRKLYEQAELLAAGHASRGMPIPPLPALIRRANQMAFAADIAANARAKVHQEIQDQSAKRRPVANQPRDPSGRFIDKPVNPLNSNAVVQSILNDPEWNAKFDQIQRESGQAV